MFQMKSVKSKILLLSVSAVALVALAMVVIILTQKGTLKGNIGKELDQLAKNETSKIAKDVYLMARATNETLQYQLENNLKVIQNDFTQKGVELSWEKVAWTATHQESKASANIELPKMLVGGQWLGQVKSQSEKAPEIDDLQQLIGGTITVFQRMNDAGDMLRISTNVINPDGTRAIGTYAPAVQSDGDRSPVIAAVLSGQTYKGTNFILGHMYLTAYGPIQDKAGKVIGMTVSAIKQENFTSLRKGILDVVVGKTGYVFVIGAKGHQKGTYIISDQGKRDGENILGAKDVDGNEFIASIIDKALATKTGSADFERYAWKNAGDTEARWKLTAVTYFEPWDWVIGAGAYEDDFHAAKARVDDSLNSMIAWGIGGAVLFLLLSSFIAVLVSNRISKPLVKMVEAANALAEGDINQDIEVTSSDEVGELAESFQKMIEAQKQMVEAAQAVSNGDTKVSIIPRSGKDVLAISLKEMVDVIKRLLTETDGLISSVQLGVLNKRGNASSFNGGYQELIQGVNDLIEAFVKPINLTSEYVDRISRGDIPEKIVEEYHGDFNKTKNSLNTCIDAVERLVSDMNLLVQSALDGRLGNRADASKHDGDFSSIVKGVNSTLDAIIEPINEAADILEKLSNRDLTARMQGDYRGDHAKIKMSLNKTGEALHDAMIQVAEASDQVAAAGNQIASSSQAVAEGASEQASALEQTSSSLEEMSSMTKQNADNSQQANILARSAKDATEIGSGSMEKMIEAMGKIQDAAEGTSQIIKDINEIAFQTNLLALNAAVEAARAGEAGRGFAVVAEEVRNLALRSKEAAKQTEELIHQSVNLAEGGVEISGEVNSKLSEVSESIAKVTNIVAEIATASQEQSRGIEQINRAVSEMDKVTQQNAANSEESASASEELSSQSQELAAMVGLFKLSRKHGGVKVKPSLPVKKDKAPVYRGKKNGSSESSNQLVLSPEDIIPLDSDPDFKEF